MGGQHHEGFSHDAFVYRGDDDFARGIGDFVRTGVDAGEAVLVAVVPPRIALLRDRLGTYRDRVRFVDISGVGRNPARIIPLWRSALDTARAEGRPLRGVGEPVYAGRTAVEIEEAQLHEALLNLAFDGSGPFRLRCPYDGIVLPADVVAGVAHSHPTLLDEGARASAGYAPHEVVAAGFTASLPIPTAAPVRLAFEHTDLRPLRELVHERAVAHGLGQYRADDLTLAVHEVCTNSIRWGGGRGMVALWTDGDAMLCEVSDAGRITEPLVGRTMPALGHEGGRGLWLANQLCDLVQIRSGARGTVIRLIASR